MKKLPQIFLLLLSVLLIITTLSACFSNKALHQPATTEADAEPIEGIYVFSFLSRYYQNVRLIEEIYRDEIYTEVYETQIGDWKNDSIRTYVNLPCGTGYVRKNGMILESLDVELHDYAKSSEENWSAEMEAAAVFHSLEGEPIMAGFEDTKPNDSLMKLLRKKWKDEFEESVEIFSGNIINAAVNDQKVIEAIVSGETVLVYSGNYNYSLYLMNLGEVSADRKDHYIIQLKIEAN